MPIKIRIIVITIISSISVKPSRRGGLCQANAKRELRLCDFFMGHQSEYLVPSSAVAWDLEYTSKTFFPPQLVESGSSCTARKPQSARPVIGSTGIFRRKRIL